MSEAVEDDVDEERGADPHASIFSRLVVAVGGPTRASQLLKKSRNTIDKYRSGQSRIPFGAVYALAEEAKLSLDEVAGRAAPAQTQVQALAEPIPDGFVPLPVLRVEAGAGGGRFAAPDDLLSADTVAFREVWLRSLGLSPGKAHILRAVGDSMQPTIRSGDMLIVDRMIDRVIDDGIYVVVIGGGVMVKRLQLRPDGSVALKSDNERYDEHVVPADEVPSLIVEGRVRWVGGPI